MSATITDRKLLEAAANGPFFKDRNSTEPYWEFTALFGHTKQNLDALIAGNFTLPRVEYEELCQKIVSHLWGYPHFKKNEIEKWLGCPHQELMSSTIEFSK